MTTPTDRLAEALKDRYTLERELGAGGMATVYLAHDLKHDRKVAIKVLRPELAAVLGAERFVQEIKTTANLQHPNILPLFDSGEADKFLYYVMPYVEGETLRDKLNRETQLGVEEAVKLTTEVADALDYAHNQNVIHRDIKPENILLHAGRPLVADFGIALAVSAAAGGRMTETGLSLGTPHYMSPEQATADKHVTHRSDIYSLGAVLYEMLTGEPPHMGNSAQAIILKIVSDEARPVTELRKSVPPNVAAAVATALEKLPADRFESAKVFAEALRTPSFLGATVARIEQTAPTRRVDRRLWVLATALLLAIGAATLGWLRSIPTPPVTRVRMGMPVGQEVVIRNGRSVAVSADGSRIVYVGPGESGVQLWLRPLGQLDATPIQGTTGAAAPIFSPDGESVAFFRWRTVDATLNVVSLRGGQPMALADGIQYHGSWGHDGYLYVSTGPPRDALARIRATGGPIEVLLAPDSEPEAGNRRRYWHAYVLPNGRGVLFSDCLGSPRVGCRIRVLDLESRESRLVVADGVGTRYVAPGFLIYARADGTLLAIPFDLDKLEVTGPSTPLVTGLPFKGGEPDFDISQNGTLVYLTVDARSSQLTWVERDGAQRPVDADLNGDFTSVALSPDGERIAFSSWGAGLEHLQVYNTRDGTLSRLSFQAARSWRPEWLPDGRRLTFVSDATGHPALYTVQADFSGPPEPTLGLGESIQDASWSRDDRWLVFNTARGRYPCERPPCSRDLKYLRVGADTTPRTFLATEFHEFNPKLSPDGRWLAYVGDESGSEEVYVRPFPGPGGRWQVSTDGGTEPLWAHSGRELFFRSRDDWMVRAEVTIGPSFSVGTRTPLFPVSQFLSGVQPEVNAYGSHTSYDISPDDRRFLMVKPSQGVQTGSLVVWLNWTTELRKLERGTR